MNFIAPAAAGLAAQVLVVDFLVPAPAYPEPNKRSLLCWLPTGWLSTCCLALRAAGPPSRRVRAAACVPPRASSRQHQPMLHERPSWISSRHQLFLVPHKRQSRFSQATFFKVSEPHLFFQRRYRPTSCQVARGLSR